jgi:hypothetical protein
MRPQPPTLLEPRPNAADELDPTPAAAEPHPQVWRGLALGLALAVAAWILLAAVVLTVYSLL